MRVLIVSDPPWMLTGYGIQTRMLTEGLQAEGWTVSVAAKSGLAGSKVCWAPDGEQAPAGVWVYPYAQNGPQAGDALPHTISQYQPDVIVTLIDVWPLLADRWKLMVKKTPVISWVPVERHPLLRPVGDWCRSSFVTRVVPMSHWGETLLRQAIPMGGKVLPAIGHGYDPAVFYPDDRRAARVRFGLPADEPIFGCVAANIGDPYLPRKGWPQMLQAWRLRVNRMGAGAGKLVLHTNPTVSAGGVDLYQMAASLQLEDTDSLIFTQTELTADGLADLYRAMDVMVLPTLGEGFGVPIIEALACHTPVVTSSWSGCQSLTPGDWQIPYESSVPVWSMGSWMRVPHPEAVAAKMSEVLDASVEPELFDRFTGPYQQTEVVRQWVTVIKEALSG